MKLASLMAFVVFFAVSSHLFSDDRDQNFSKTIQITPVAPTPESNAVALKIAVPKQGAFIRENPVWIQFRIDGYSLGSDSSQFERSNEIMVSPLGQTVRIVIDNAPYFSINEAAINPFNEEGYFYTMSYKFKVPFHLAEGIHTIRAFPVRSFGESMKGEGTFFSTYFYVGSNLSGDNESLTKPYLTYNEPSDQFDLKVGRPILLDFLVTNCVLSKDGYRVRLTIDSNQSMIITNWQPHYIYGLPKGRHKIRLELLNKEKKVPGVFNDVTRTIFVTD